MDKNILKQSPESNDVFDDAACLLVHEIANGQRDELSEGMSEVAQRMAETVERETGYLPDVIMLLEVYCAFHPDVPYAVAREKVLKATERVSKGGLNPIEDDSLREAARNQAAALVFGDEFEEFGDFSGISFQWVWMRFIDEHPEAADLDEKTDCGLFARWMGNRFAKADGNQSAVSPRGAEQ
jgi:hypothetical protein